MSNLTKSKRQREQVCRQKQLTFDDKPAGKSPNFRLLKSADSAPRPKRLSATPDPRWVFSFVAPSQAEFDLLIAQDERGRADG